jgi:Mg2+-importing ATPase
MFGLRRIAASVKGGETIPRGTDSDQWWNGSRPDVLAAVRAAESGLTEAEAARRRRDFGRNRIADPTRRPLLFELLARFGSPMLLLLLAAATLAAFLGDAQSAAIIAAVVGASALLDFVQEHAAQRAIDRLRASVAVHACVVRDGRPREVPAEDIVPGDVIVLSAGDLVPADLMVLESRDLFVNQATLTGESFPVEKWPHVDPAAGTDLTSLRSVAFMGTSVLSGAARGMAVTTGRHTELAKIAEVLARQRPPDPLAQGTRRFGFLILRATLVLSLVVLVLNTSLGHPWLDSLMFALALAVGLAPELLPMIVSVTLARGALRLARRRVIVKRPAAVYGLGSIDTICTDKTGTLTEGRLALVRHVDVWGNETERVLDLAYLNSMFETGIRSPLDAAVIAHGARGVEGWKKLDEVPFDFERRRVSVLVEGPRRERLLIVKGAPEEILARCSEFETPSGQRQALTDAAADSARERFAAFGNEGLRTLAVAWQEMPAAWTSAAPHSEDGLVFAGLLAFVDPPRKDAARALAALQADGLEIKVLSGDNERVVRHLCSEVHLAVGGVLLGEEIQRMDDVALGAAAQAVNAFCRVTPPQKERILRALKQRGRSVAFLGDGVNDAPALRMADVGISVDGAVDVAKDAADVMLTRHDLTALHAGVQEGRRTYGNIMKYLMMATSSNFGNMASMAAAPLLLPFLPLLPAQVLLNNLLYDLSELAIPLDRVDRGELRRPHRWDASFIRNFMLTLGPLSSLFDLLTFYVLLAVLHFDAALFRTGWFVESVITQVLVIFVIRTRGPPLSSRPHPVLAMASLTIVAVAVLLPYTALGARFSLVPLPAHYFAVLGVIVVGYLVLAEVGKRWFYRRLARSG